MTRNCHLNVQQTPPTVQTRATTKRYSPDWHQRLGSGVHADAIMDRIVHRTIWIETGGTNMREHTADNAA